MKYFSSIEPEIINFSKGVIPDNYLFEKRAAVFASSVFLAHSSADKEDLPKVISFLERQGARVYIDKSDKELPQKTSTQTGVKLKERIAQCSKFIVLVTSNSKNSRWIPWELGIADEKKKLSNVALLPDVGNQINPEWPEQEYLGLYPRIVHGPHQSFSGPIWMVLNHHENTATELGQWIRRTN